jgi:hypothetical protein
MDEHLQIAPLPRKAFGYKHDTQISGKLEKREPGPFFANRVLCELRRKNKKVVASRLAP